MGITFVLTAVSTLTVGIIIGFLISYCVVKRRTTVKQQVTKPIGGPQGQLYEEVPHSKSSKQNFEMGQNTAYEPVRQ